MADIHVSQLQRGDVLLKYTEGTGTNKLINFGQFVMSHNKSGGHSTTVHAAIYSGGGNVCEASGHGGLQFAGMKAGLIYFVHRYHDAGLADLAAAIAEGYVEERNRSGGTYGSYSKSGAFGSLVHSSSRGKKAKQAETGLWGQSPNQPSDSFYCSSFVVRAYAAAGQTNSPAVVPIDCDFRAVSPKELEARLKKAANWSEVGRLRT